MEVKRYLFQSPYSSPVQFGRPENVRTQQEDQSLDVQTQTEQKAQSVKNAITQTEVKPEVSGSASTSLLDVYA